MKYHDTHFLLKYQDTHSLYLALILIPLIRIIGVSLPQSGIPQVFAFTAVGAPLFMAGVIVAKIVGITPASIGFGLNKFYRQLMIALIGIPLGYLEFYAQRLTFKEIPEAPDGILIWVLTFIIFIGLLEEFIFRGILFNIADRYLETNKAMVFTSILYAALTISDRSFFSLFFAFLISLLFCRIFVRYKSIVGISLAHGLINITLYILCPLMTGMK